jgi:nucleoside-diphosphate-sugar epimerase
MRVLVTGGSGFIGSTLVPALVVSGHDVSTGDMEGCDALVHLANIAHARVPRALLWKVNVEGTRQLAERAAASGVRRMVYLSSIKASGEESGSKPFDGSESPSPEDEYGRTKLAAEQALAEVAARSSLRVLVLRPPLVYGPGVKGNFLALMRWIARGRPLPLASIRNRRSLVYVGNLADAIVRCLERPVSGVYTLSDGAPLSTPELCSEIGKALGRPARLFGFPASLLTRLPGGKRLTASLVIDDGRLRSELGWQPPIDLHEAMRATARWYLGR